MTFVSPESMEKKPKPRRAKSYAVKTLDPLFAKVVRLSGSCTACLSHDRIQCAHIVSRRYRATRWDRDNAMPLCAKCHTYYTHRPLEWEAWVVSRIGEGRWFDLKARALAGRKWTRAELEDRAAELREVLAAYESGDE